MTQLSSVRDDASPAARRLLGRCAVGALRVTACRPIARPARLTTLVSRPLAVRLLGRSASGHRAASACRPVARSARFAAVPRPLPVWSPSRCASRHGPEVQAVDRSPVHTSEPATVLENPPVAAVSRRFRRPGVSPGPVPVPGDVGDFYARDRMPHKGFAGGISTDFRIHRMIHSWGPVVPGPSTAVPRSSTVASTTARRRVHHVGWLGGTSGHPHGGARRDHAGVSVTYGQCRQLRPAAGPAVGQEPGGQREQTGVRIGIAGVSARGRRRMPTSLGSSR